MKRKKIIFVCTGNTCRSPMAEALLRNKIKKNKIKWWDVASYGIHAEVGGQISPNSKQALNEVGVNVSPKFVPRQLTQKVLSSATLVVCMTSSQKQMLEDCGAVVSIKDVCGKEVPDPYGLDIQAYRATRDVLSVACDIIINNFVTQYIE